jgi:arginine N-succinyltransferase
LNFTIRAGRGSDLDPLYQMAKLTGGGFTNLPPDRTALQAKLAASEEACARRGGGLVDETFLLVLENSRTGEVRGTCQLFTKVGQRWPFYSYRLNTLTQHSRELNRTVRAELLSLVTDLEGSSEVGGLFLHPNERAGGLGMLLARSRYLFIARHRPRFADRILAELRGIIDERGGSPFWDGVAGRFFEMSFQEADYFNAINGNQFIADLMPKHPVYVAMLAEDARGVIGVPHPSGRAAMRMLEKEGFSYEGYVDIFDGGPTMLARTDRVRSVAQAVSGRVEHTDCEDGTPALIAAGELAQYRCGYGGMTVLEERAIAIEANAAEMLRLAPGDEVTVIAR